jgi:WD40 repeat protein
MLLSAEPGDTVTGLAFSPDGQKLACSVLRSSLSTKVHIWDLDNGRGLQTLRGLPGQVFKVRYSPDGRFLAALAMNWQVGIWNLQTSQLLHVLDAPKGLFVDNSGLAFSPDGHRFAFSAGKEAKLWDVATGKGLASWQLPPGLEDTLAFTQADKLLLARFEKQNGNRWTCNLRSLLVPNALKLIAEIEDFDREFHIFAPPYGSCFVVQGKGPGTKLRQTFRVFDWASGNRLWSAPESKSQDAGFDAIDPTGKALAFHYGPNHDDNLLMEIPSGKLLGSYGPLGSLSPGAKLGTRFEGKPSYGISLLRPDEKSALVTLGIDSEVSSHPHFSPRGKHLAWGNTDGSVTVCDIDEVRRRLTELGLGW